jgi:hypothetical protein
MRMKTRLALVGAAFAVAAGGFSIPLAGTASAYPSSTPASVSTPNMEGQDVANGGLLTVKGSNYPPGSVNPSGIQILECSDPGGTVANLPLDAAGGCDGLTVNGNQITPSSSGSFTDEYGVQALSTTSGSNINCDATDYCVLWVGTDYNSDFSDPANESFSAPFLVTAPTAPSITSGNSASFPMFQHSPVPSFTVTATGINAPALAESGTLPGGVSFTDDGNGTATLTGTPSSAGTFPITITASNGTTPNATQSFTLYAGFVVTTSSLPPASLTGSYGPVQLTAVGGTTPYKWKVKGLPKGLKASKQGSIAGTLKSKDKPGPYTVSITVTDSKIKSSTKHPNPNGHGKETATKTLTLTVS